MYESIFRPTKCNMLVYVCFFKFTEQLQTSPKYVIEIRNISDP
jgi:hypothetical protein